MLSSRPGGFGFTPAAFQEDGAKITSARLALRLLLLQLMPPLALLLDAALTSSA